MTAARDAIRMRAFDAFKADAEAIPPITLRGGDALDSYDEPPPYDAGIDEPTDAYLETFAFNGLNFLDAASWRHYLPRLIDYALRHIASNAPGILLPMFRSCPHRRPGLAVGVSLADDAPARRAR